MAKSKFMENAESLSIEYALPTQEECNEIRLILPNKNIRYAIYLEQLAKWFYQCCLKTGRLAVKQ
jgi:hypothetical protein